ncbi:MAG: 3-oxoacyl-ACP reductase family protein [Candidatus Latescibacteria bacterium]|jgi:NAD(P)-dependent dehydrogenase (short-subunit alcohol dehydrogenase family)|nr:3-oxoacyl-ACP reductase family protein [Candidatus Latescibacterota bacterium]MDP7238927.1 3-oxoacyl-ACP reductase family protein [Candidatus Latescibacterota bacterium]
MADLTGKIALVTGAGGEHGIGRAIAVRLAADGADVVVNDLVKVPYSGASDVWKGLAAVVEEIATLGQKSLAIEADVSDAAQVQNMVDEVIDKFGHIDILVNNAGSRPGKDRVPVVDLEEEVWDHLQRVNVKGTFLCCRAVVREMIDHEQGGKVINISSTAGRQGVAKYAAYCTSKFAIIGFTQSLAQEVGPFGINVNAICPGLTDTERVYFMADALAPEGITGTDFRPAMLEDFASQVAMGRVAKPDDIARTAAFLSSSESDYLTGLSVPVCGGIQM